MTIINALEAAGPYQFQAPLEAIRGVNRLDVAVAGRIRTVDPLTHTLVGANLASTRLGQSTRYGAAASLIGANLPDIDVLSYFWGDVAIGFRRGCAPFDGVTSSFFAA